MRRYAKFLAAGAVATALVLPASAALAADTDPVCTGDQRQEQIHQQALDGSQAGQMAQHRNGADAADHQGAGQAQGAAHKSGPQDGSGPQADRALDGTGNQWGRNR